MSVVIFPNFISPAECAELSQWTEVATRNEWLDKGISHNGLANANKRYSSRSYTEKFETYPELAYSIYDRIASFLGLESLEKSANNGGKDSIVTSCTLPGGDVFKHVDLLEPNGHHLLRCNIVTQPAETGGELYVHGNKINIGVGDLHCYLATKYYHHVTGVDGNTNRILWMFGYQISPTDSRYSRWS